MKNYFKMDNIKDLTTEEREAKLQRKALEMIEEIDKYIELGEAKLKEVEAKKSKKSK